VKALVIQHSPTAPAGYVEEWLRERGLEPDVYRIDLGEREIEPRDYELIVTLGSECAADDDSVAWIAPELRVLRAAARADVAVLGICFGAQILARALGGQVSRNQRPEIGWHEIHSYDPSVIDPGPWLQWHFDRFTPPPGAVLLADSPAGPQAFAAGRSLGLQFHPEASPEIVQDWADEAPRELEQEGIDPERLMAETRERAADARTGSFRILDAFFERIGSARVG
jgi:GMP synthase-like glutamine amidotransferase